MRRRLALLLGLLAGLAGEPSRADGPGEVPTRRLQATPGGRLAGPEADGAGRRSALVLLREQVDFRRLVERPGVREARGEARREAVLEALREVSRDGAERLAAELRRGPLAADLAEIRPLVIVNALVVEAPLAALVRLQTRPEVAVVLVDGARAMSTEAGTTGGPTPPGRLRAAYLRAAADVGAEAAWARGLRGEGTVLGVLDTGVDAGHAQLRPTWRATDGWFDPSGSSPEPRDRAGHGSLACALAAGANASGLPLAVAPGARWVAALALPGNRYSESVFAEAADWMLRRGRPDVLLLAMGLETGTCEEWLTPVLDPFRASGVVIVAAAGNEGSERPPTDISPANLVLHDGRPILSVGALGVGGRLWSDSALGPGSCDGGLYPLIVAPGEAVATVAPGTSDGVQLADGTSVAAGLVAGAALVLRQVAPEASAGDVEAALRSSARDLGPAGADPLFGWGALDLAAALERLADGRPSAPPAAPR